MNKYCDVAPYRNGSKERPDLDYFCFAVKSDHRKKWEVFCKRAGKKNKRLIDPKICTLHFKENDIAISISGRKIFLQVAIRLSLALRKRRIRPVRARAKRLDNGKRRCAEQTKDIKGEALRLLRTKSSAKEFKTRISHFRVKLINRGYPAETLIKTALSEIKFKDRKLALRQKCKEDKRILSFKTQYGPTVPNLKQRLMQKWHLIQQQPQLSEMFKDPRAFPTKGAAP